MSIAAGEKISGNAKAEEVKNRLGISRTIYAVGYSVKDAFIWGMAATLAVFGIITLGSKFEIRPIEKFADKLTRGHKWWKELTGKYVKEGVGSAAIIAGFIVGHLVQIPSLPVGWRKAKAAIDKHNTLHEEKDQLVETNTVLMAENEQLKAALAAAEKNRPPLADRIRAQSSEASAGRSA